MQFIKYGFFLFLIMLGLYAASMYFFVDESKSFKIEKEINYPIEKVFPQFNNLQNFARWNNYFSDSKTMNVAYYLPYEGQGSAMSFEDINTKKAGEMYINYQNLNSTLKYQLFENKKGNPTFINIKFSKFSKDKTKIIWFVHTPKKNLLERSVNLWTEDDFADNLDKSMQNLKNILGNKVDKDSELANIKYDSLMVEKKASQLLLGVNVSTKNVKDALFKNIVMNHNKVLNYVTTDLGKREDEIGFPILITASNNFKDKEVSYFYGIPVSKKQSISDNNFSYKTLNPSENYVIYYKGTYAGRIREVQQLLQKAKNETKQTGDLQETILVAPVEGGEVNMKLSLPVFQ